MQIEVFTDGSGTTGNKAAGYGWVIVVDGAKKAEGNGHITQGTNNDAEMEAAIQGLAAAYKLIQDMKTELSVLKADFATLQSMKDGFHVTLCSDSQITLGWANGSYRFKQEHKYQRFAVLKKLVEKLDAKTRWVRGHSGHEWNERCDELANLGRHKLGPNDKVPTRQQKRSTSEAKKLALTAIRNIAKLLEGYPDLVPSHHIKAECDKVLQELE